MSGLYELVEALAGIDRERCQTGQERLRALGIAHLTAELSDVQTVDAVVGAVTLVEAIEVLVDAGISESRLRAKLRRDPDVWPTWAEIRAVQAFIRSFEGVEVDLEPGRERGRHPDFQVAFGGEDPVAVEVKALGLSDREAAFCNLVTPTLRGITPRRGIATLHATLDVQSFDLNRHERRHAARQAEGLARNLPPHLRQLSATVAIAHGSEAAYVARLRDRFHLALAQVPSDQPSLVCFHWSNGAPARMIEQALRDVELPGNIEGLALFGSVVLTPDPHIHNFLVLRESPFQSDADLDFRSFMDESLGRVIFDALERAAVPVNS